MKTFIIQTNQDTFFEIEIDDTQYDKYKNMATEAMARALELFFNSPQDGDGLSYILIAYEKGYEHDMDKKIVTLTEYVLRNAGYHDIADDCLKKLKKLTSKPLG